MPCNHALDEFDICVYRCDSAVEALLCLDCNTDLSGGHQSTDLNLCQPCKDYREQGDEGEDDRTTFDLSDDADALASAGWGTDEDYGGWGDE